MLSAAARARLTVVLVSARNPWNIGAAARAMRDFGFSDLRVVNVFSPPFEAAQIESQIESQAEIQARDTAQQNEGAKAAVGAASVLENARRFDRLEDAIADCTLVAGTTAIGERGLRRPVLPLREATPQILGALQDMSSQPEQVEAQDANAHSSPDARVALLFGSEKTGLTNEQLSHCSLLLTIPMFAPDGRHLSMNLGQAVAVCLYELAREGFEGARELPPAHAGPVTAASRERLTRMLLRAMAASGYSRRFPAQSREHVVRQLVNGLGRDEDEAVTWMGFLRQVTRNTDQHPDQDADTI
ncbi:MAG TPA: RNA methyltransferase [Acidobacteriaceae bacterium]|nr:RNA methyltransferase [Acidobacteriaceae bacterium]